MFLLSVVLVAQQQQNIQIIQSQNSELIAFQTAFVELRNENFSQKNQIDLLDLSIHDLKDKEIKENESMDSRALLRLVTRDTKRLDGFNELLMTTRTEIKTVIQSVISMENNLRQFNIYIAELVNYFDNFSNIFNSQMQIQYQHLHQVEKSVGYLWDMTIRSSQSDSKIIINFNTIFHQIQKLLDGLYYKTFPPFHSIDELLLEIQNFTELINDKKVLFEEEKNKYLEFPNFSKPILKHHEIFS